MKFKTNKMKTIFDLQDNPLGICIHKYIGCGESLFLTCHKLHIDAQDLHTKDMDEAVKKSQWIISEVLREINLNAKKFIIDDSDIEFTAY